MRDCNLVHRTGKNRVAKEELRHTLVVTEEENKTIIIAHFTVPER